MSVPYFDPWRIKVIEEITISTREERERWIKEVDYNLFDLKSSQIMVDLLTDSGTGGLSNRQWAAMMTADESYAGSLSFENLQKTVREITGYPYLIPAHQGRASENVLMSAVVHKGDVIPGNKHFFTTQLHIERNGGKVIDCTVSEAENPNSMFAFKGNLDLRKLEAVYQKYGRVHIPFCLITITCNSVGGQPVSLENIKQVKTLSDRYGIPVFYDAARFAQNAYFIKTREPAYKDKSIKEIARKIFDHADGMFMSSKKDGLVNMGGFIALNNESVYQKALAKTVLFEGYATYGGMSGLALNALARGLKEATEYKYLKSRIGQVQYLGEKLTEYGVPILQPVSGHAVFLDALQILPRVPRAQCPSHVLAVALYKEGGIRAGNGSFFTGIRDENGTVSYPKNEWLRMTVPQRLYTQNHLDYVAVIVKNVMKRNQELTSGYEVIYEPEEPVMKIFGIKLKECE